MQYLGYTKRLFVVYLKFKFNWANCTFSDNPLPQPSSLEMKAGVGWGWEWEWGDLSPCELRPGG